MFIQSSEPDSRKRVSPGQAFLRKEHPRADALPAIWRGLRGVATTCCHLLWSAVVVCGRLWYSVVCCGILWSPVVFCGRCGILWSAVVSCGLLWYSVVGCGILWYSVVPRCAHTPTVGDSATGWLGDSAVGDSARRLAGWLAGQPARPPGKAPISRRGTICTRGLTKTRARQETG